MLNYIFYSSLILEFVLKSLIFILFPLHFLHYISSQLKCSTYLFINQLFVKQLKNIESQFYITYLNNTYNIH